MHQPDNESHNTTHRQTLPQQFVRFTLSLGYEVRISIPLPFSCPCRSPRWSKSSWLGPSRSSATRRYFRAASGRINSPACVAAFAAGPLCGRCGRRSEAMMTRPGRQRSRFSDTDETSVQRCVVSGHLDVAIDGIDRRRRRAGAAQSRHGQRRRR